MELSHELLDKFARSLTQECSQDNVEHAISVLKESEVSAQLGERAWEVPFLAYLLLKFVRGEYQLHILLTDCELAANDPRYAPQIEVELETQDGRTLKSRFVEGSPSRAVIQLDDLESLSGAELKLVT